MNPRRLVVLPALAAALFAAAAAFAAPTITPATLQCDGVTYQDGGYTHAPKPSIQVTVQDLTGLRIGQATMGLTATAGNTLALWRFDATGSAGVTTALTCAAAAACAGNACLTYTYTYTAPDGSSPLILGDCVYNGTTNNCGTAVSAGLNAGKSLIPVGLAACPAGVPAVAPTIIPVFGAGQFGGVDGNATFNGTTQFSSVTAPNEFYCTDHTVCTPSGSTTVCDDVIYHCANNVVCSPDGSPGVCADSSVCGSGTSTPDTCGNGGFGQDYNNTLNDLPANYTLSAWIKATNNGLNQRVLSQQGGPQYWGFGLNSAGGVRLFDSRNTVAPVNCTVPNCLDATMGSGLANGAWHKIDVVRINGLGGTERFYADGALLGTIPAYSTDTFANHPMVNNPAIIGEFQGGSEYFNGTIAEIRVLDVSLTDEEIYLEYNGSNVHQYSSNSGASFSHVLGGFPGGVTNGDVGVANYAPTPDGVSPAITVATELYTLANPLGDQRWIFEAQNTNTASNFLSSFAVSIDTSLPTAPRTFSGAPTGTSTILWSWSAPLTFCQPPGSGAPTSVYYDLYDAETGALIQGNIAYTSLSISDGSLSGPNQIHSSRLNLTDFWGTSPLTASASAYTLAAVPTGLTDVSVSTGGFVASWGANGNPGFTRYELNYTSDPNFLVGISTRVGISNNFTGTSINVTGLASGTTTYVRVRAFNGQVSDSYGGVATAFTSVLLAVTEPPSPVLTGVPLSNHSIQWNWTSEPGATGYSLYDVPTFPTPLGVADMDALTFTSGTVLPWLAVNTRYDAEVQAILPFPTPPSGFGTAFTYTLANPPVATAVSAVYATSATFAWGANGNPGYTFYQVIVSTDASFGVITATITVSAPAATLTGLLPGVTYYSQVQAINGGQISAPLNSYVAIPNVATAPDPFISVSSSPASPYVATTGLVGAWQFDEDTGTFTADSTGSGNNGNLDCLPSGPACVSTPTWTSGPPGMGTAASFSGGPGGTVLTNRGISIPGSLTIEAWVNPATSHQTAAAGIVAVGTRTIEDFALDVSAAGAFEFATSNSGVEFLTTAPAPVVAGQWTHVVGVYDLAHASATLYVNGVAVATHLGMPARANLFPPLSIGNRQDATGSFATLPFAGKIDSVRLFNVALTAPQVLSDYLGAFISSVTAPPPNTGIIVSLPANAFGPLGAPAQIYITADPVNNPIRITPAAMNAGLAHTPAGLTLVPNSLIEVVPVVGGVPFTGPLGSSATVTIPYKDPGNTGVISGTNPPLGAAGIQMYTLNTAVNSWVLLPTVVDKVAHTGNGLTPHFSVFALFAPSTFGTSLAGVGAYPVPWKPGTGGRFDAPGVTFSPLPASGTIRILTLSGKQVKDFSFNGGSNGSAVWDGTNDDGRRTASGVYFARITSGADGSTILVKFAVER